MLFVVTRNHVNKHMLLMTQCDINVHAINIIDITMDRLILENIMVIKKLYIKVK